MDFNRHTSLCDRAFVSIYILMLYVDVHSFKPCLDYLYIGNLWSNDCFVFGCFTKTPELSYQNNSQT